jgi:hypothetical protein
VVGDGVVLGEAGRGACCERFEGVGFIEERESMFHDGLADDSLDTRFFILD